MAAHWITRRWKNFDCWHCVGSGKARSPSEVVKSLGMNRTSDKRLDVGLNVDLSRSPSIGHTHELVAHEGQPAHFSRLRPIEHDETNHPDIYRRRNFRRFVTRDEGDRAAAPP